MESDFFKYNYTEMFFSLIIDNRDNVIITIIQILTLTVIILNYFICVACHP